MGSKEISIDTMLDLNLTPSYNLGSEIKYCPNICITKDYYLTDVRLNNDKRNENNEDEEKQFLSPREICFKFLMFFLL